MTSGCISIQKSNGTGIRESPVVTPIETVMPSGPSWPTPVTITPAITQSSSVVPADSIPLEDFPLSKNPKAGAVSGGTPSRYRTTIFKERYTLRYTNVGLLATVATPPFIIRYTVFPEDPNPHYCFLRIVVRDAETGDVITEEGYGQPYSTERSKEIILYRGGKFHITVYGNRIQVDILIVTGDAEAPLTPTPVSQGYPEEREEW